MAIYHRETLDRTFHALGDGTRRAMLAMVARNGEMSAGELGEPFHISQPTASKHLRVLESAGLLSRHIEGRVHRFRLRSGPLVEAEDWITRHRDFWTRTLDRLGPVLAELDEGG